MTRPRDSTLARSLVRSVGRVGRVGYAARAFRGAKDPRSAPRRSPRDPFAAAGRGDFFVCATAVRASPCITPRAPHPRHAALPIPATPLRIPTRARARGRRRRRRRRCRHHRRRRSLDRSLDRSHDRSIDRMVRTAHAPVRTRARTRRC